MTPRVMAFHDNNSLARPHYRGTAQGLRVIIQGEGVDQGVLCHLENTLQNHLVKFVLAVYTVPITNTFFLLMTLCISALTVNELPQFCSADSKINT